MLNDFIEHRTSFYNSSIKTLSVIKQFETELSLVINKIISETKDELLHILGYDCKPSFEIPLETILDIEYGFYMEINVSIDLSEAHADSLYTPSDCFRHIGNKYAKEVSEIGLKMGYPDFTIQCY